MEMEMQHDDFLMPKDEPITPGDQYNYQDMPAPERGDSYNSLKSCPSSGPLSSGLLLPDAVKRIAQEGIAIRWDPTIGCYEVLDGPLFEQRIEALRRKREGGRDSGRPFSRMHKYYTLESGIGWAKTAAVFKPKSANLVRPPGPTPGGGQQPLAPVHQPVPTFSFDPNAPSGVRPGWQAAPMQPVMPEASNQVHQNAWTPQSNKRPRVDESADSALPGPQSAALSAENVTVKLMTGKSRAPYVNESFEVSLQHFLDTINAGEKYQRAVERAQTDTSCGSSSVGGDSLPPSTPISWDEAPSPIESELGLNLKNSFDNAPQPPMQQVDQSGWNLWTATSKGDQAYFFQRKAGQAPFPNGSIVALSCGNLVPADAECEAEMLLVVSDLNAKWKGDPHPTPEQEARGHWCAYLGQVPIKVEGAVKAGQYIGPAGDGSGYGKVCVPGVDPVVGMALADKPAGADGDVVKCMVSVGLNVLATRPATLTEEKEQQLIQRVTSSGQRVRRLAEEASAEAQRATKKVAALSAHVERIQSQVDSLEELSRALSATTPHAEAAPPRAVKRSTWGCLFGLCSLTVEEGGPPASHAVLAAPRVAREWSSALEEALHDTTLTLVLMLAVLGAVANLEIWRAAPELDVFHAVLVLFAVAWIARPVGMVAGELGRRGLCAVSGIKDHSAPKSVVQVLAANHRSVAALLVCYALLGSAVAATSAVVQIGYVFGVVQTLKVAARHATVGSGVECQVLLRSEAAV